MNRFQMALTLSVALLFNVSDGYAESAGFDNLMPELIQVPTGMHEYRLSGEVLKNGHPVNAPMQNIYFPRILHIMKYQVSSHNYALCVDDNLCSAPFRKQDRHKNFPVVGISFIDAQNYAEWLSQKTGVTWRLPTDAEWSWSAGDRFFDDAFGVSDSMNELSKRWIDDYRKSYTYTSKSDTVVNARGTYGANENGLYDQSGNVWEWTDTCYQRYQLSLDDKLEMAGTPNCGVRILEGRHRSYMTNFIQDAIGGGCSAGTPPNFLGFRLVRDNPKFLSIKRFQNWMASVLRR